jgi:hypothetical protein
MRTVKLSVALVAVLALMTLATQVALAQSAFDVQVSFELSDTKVKANPSIKIHIEQPADQPEMGHVTLRIPKGFKLPLDAKIDNADRVGIADLSIHSGPKCAGAGPVSAPAMFPDRPLYEQDRTDEQADRGVKAVWVVDLRPVTTIPLEITGNAKKGWKLDGDIPANPFTCPPILFDAEIYPKTQTGEVPILRNRSTPGNATFQAIFTTQDSPDIDVNKQVITITP